MAWPKMMQVGREEFVHGGGSADQDGRFNVTSQEIFRALREVVLLSGSVRADRFNTPIGRSVLAMPVDRGNTLLEQWSGQVRGLAEGLGTGGFTVRVMLDRASPLPPLPAAGGPVAFSVERDPGDLRGTGGVLRDVAAAYHDDDDYLLVANGAQVVIGSLLEYTAILADRGGDVVIAAHRDGTPSGLMLVRCGSLRGIASEGFVDMKEQALPAIARDHEVRVVFFDQPTAQPVRGLADYIAALRIHHHQSANLPVDHNPFAENLGSTFTVVEEGARVDDGALLHDAVVLAGAVIEADAAVVRSVVCPGGRVRAGQRVVDRIVGGKAPARKVDG